MHFKSLENLIFKLYFGYYRISTTRILAKILLLLCELLIISVALIFIPLYLQQKVANLTFNLGRIFQHCNIC